MRGYCPVTAILFLLGCDGAFLESRIEAFPEPTPSVVNLCDDPALVRQIRQAFQSQCMDLNPAVETDVTSPNFGEATCSVIESRDIAEHPDFCDCQEQGYAPLSDEELQAAIARLKDEAPTVAQCAIDLCFCEFQQLSGTDREACQTGPRISTNGWCYVAPERGVGEAAALEGSDAKDCPDAEGIVYTGALLDGTRVITCWR